MKFDIKNHRLGKLLMVLTILVLSDCAGKHQVALQETKSPSTIQKSSEEQPSVATESAASSETAAATTLKAAAPVSWQKKKLRFFSLLRPIVDAENATIMRTRHRLEHLKRQKTLSVAELGELRRMAAEYSVTMPNRPNGAFWTTMLKRVDIVPLELVLAQAANESAWGTSRFAQEGNNYFGEWCFSKGCGIVPAHRDAGATHEVQAFDSPRDSVHSYMHNLNTLQAYSSLRTLRYHLRKTHKPLSAKLLAMGLAQYSERGMAYVKSIRTFIRVNWEAMHMARSDRSQLQTAMGALIASSQ